MGCGASSQNRDGTPDSSVSNSNQKNASLTSAPPGSKYDTASTPPAVNPPADDDEGPATHETQAATVVRRSSLITVTHTRNIKASSTTTVPKLTNRFTEPKLTENALPKSSNPSEEKKEKKEDDPMFIFGDFNVDPGDVKRQRIERLNRIARPVATLRRRTSNLESSGGPESAPTTKPEEPLFMLNDFVIKVMDNDLDDGAVATVTFFNEIKVPTGFRQLRSFEYHSLIGCPLRVKSLALLADEQTFLVASIEDTAPVLINTLSGTEVSCFVGHGNSITAVTVSRDGKLIATCSRDNTVAIWDAPGVKDNAMRKQNRTLCDAQGAQNSIPLCAAFSYDASLIVVGYQDRVCRVWDLTSRDSMIIALMDEHKGVVVTLAMHPKENLCASGAGDKSILLWKATDATVIRRFLGHEGPVLSLYFSLDGDRILSCDSRTCKLWKTDDASCVMTVRLTDLFPNAITAPVPSTSMRRGTTAVGGPKTDTPTKRQAGASSPTANSITQALAGPHTMATIRKSLESNAAAQNASFTGVCFAPGMLSNSYFVVATTLNFVVVVSLASGKEELRVPTKGPVFSMGQGRLSTIMVGDMFGNVYRLVLKP